MFQCLENQFEKCSSALKVLFVFVVGNEELHKHFCSIDNTIHKFFSFFEAICVTYSIPQYQCYSRGRIFALSLNNLTLIKRNK